MPALTLRCDDGETRIRAHHDFHGEFTAWVARDAQSHLSRGHGVFEMIDRQSQA